MSDYSSHEHIVSFLFCKFCEHKNKAETEEPCCYCLENSTNYETRRPVHFKDDGSLERYFKKELTNKIKGE